MKPIIQTEDTFTCSIRLFPLHHLSHFQMSAMLRPLRRAAAPSAWQRAAAIRSLSRSLFGCSSPPSAASQETESGEQKPTPPSDQTALDDVLRPAAASDDMLPALTVLSESLGLLRESPAFQNWSATDWLMGLTGGLLAHAIWHSHRSNCSSCSN